MKIEKLLEMLENKKAEIEAIEILPFNIAEDLGVKIGSDSSQSIIDQEFRKRYDQKLYDLKAINAAIENANQRLLIDHALNLIS